MDRALRLCSLNEGDRPFHLVMDIAPAPLPADSVQGIEAHAQNMRAQIEVFWLNSITYRTIIRSRNFNQIRIVNGKAIEEHDTGDFYPRWIQNFVDAILNPLPKAALLKTIPGDVPVGVQAHACISNTFPPGSPNETEEAQICFQDAEPRIASGVDFTRSIWFDNFAPFGSQQIARTLVNDLPPNILVRGQIILLEPLRPTDYPSLRAEEFTPPAKRIETALVSRNTAESLLDSGQSMPAFSAGHSLSDPLTEGQMVVYVRTDRSGRVREAYREGSDSFDPRDDAVTRALTLHFKPLIIDGAPRQMEAPIILPS